MKGKRKSKTDKVKQQVYRAPAGTAHSDSDSDEDMDTPSARKGETMWTVDSGATDNFMTRDCPVTNVRKCKPIAFEVAAGGSIIADERADFVGWIETDDGSYAYTKVITPVIRGDFHENLLAVRQCNRASYSVLCILDEDDSRFTHKKTGECYIQSSAPRQVFTFASATSTPDARKHWALQYSTRTW
jgi:hypothetical protein